MPTNSTRNKQHFFLTNHGKRERYISPIQGRSSSVFPHRNNSSHAAFLEASLTQAVISGTSIIRDPQIQGGVPGFYLEFELPAQYSSIADKLENKQGKKHIELLTVHPSIEADKIIATVFVPESRKDYYLNKIRKYGKSTEEQPPNVALISSIEAIRLAAPRSLFTDDPATFPSAGTLVWWEVWIIPTQEEFFIRAAQAVGVAIREHPIKFAERMVFLVNARPDDLGAIINNTNAIAELRLAKDNPAFFMQLHPKEQIEWTDDLLSRVDMPNIDAPAVCILDSGCTRGHSLLEPLLSENDWQSYKPEWSPADNASQWRGHGTEMAGLAAYGDLTTVLTTTERITIGHRLETVKILPDSSQNEPHLYGAITGASVALAEQRAPQRQRTICMAVTAPGNQWLGKPSSWSAAVDDLAYGDENEQRLFVISTGNIREALTNSDYINRNDISPIENPSQAWNALTVGAYTEKINITSADFQDWQPFAPAMDISPCSRTSVGIRSWPIKPDVMFEGGNLAIPPNNVAADCIDDLSLLTTFNRPLERLLTTTGDTSAATALAARMATQIFTDKPALWPETVRALMVHSAEWTDAMIARLPARPTKTDYATLVGRYGYGVPNIERALRSLNNDVTMVVEDELQPFMTEDGKIKTRDLMLHDFKWPRQVLESLGNTPVEMKVTLSYFIEPNPGERGWTKHHTYASHGLRFIVKSSTESLRAFHSRINKVAREEEENYQHTSMSDEGWIIGSKRNRGSLHCDIWRGSAIDLASKHAIAIYPVGGWWREKPALRRAERQTRYALIVSLRAYSSENIDLYTPIAVQISPEITIEV